MDISNICYNSSFSVSLRIVFISMKDHFYSQNEFKIRGHIIGNKAYHVTIQKHDNWYIGNIHTYPCHISSSRLITYMSCKGTCSHNMAIFFSKYFCFSGKRNDSCFTLFVNLLNLRYTWKSGIKNFPCISALDGFLKFSNQQFKIFGISAAMKRSISNYGHHIWLKAYDYKQKCILNAFY